MPGTELINSIFGQAGKGLGAKKQTMLNLSLPVKDLGTCDERRDHQSGHISRRVMPFQQIIHQLKAYIVIYPMKLHVV